MIDAPRDQAQFGGHEGCPILRCRVGYALATGASTGSCSIARFTGTTIGADDGGDRTEIPPTGESYAVDFCSVAKWHDGLRGGEPHVDLVTFRKQIDLSA